MNEETYKQAYKQLNESQKEAVDSIDGPVMVVAGPGTGKTQILTLRIANILNKTDLGADGILCLTFTNSGVKAMRERLRKYIGAEASKVHVSTFHSFGMNIVEKYYSLLGLSDVPKVMDEKDSIALCDSILHGNEWEYIRPRSDTSRYFRDLKSLISLLKRERILPAAFEDLIKSEINKVKNDPENISSRGSTKGELKKDVQKKIEGLLRTKEAVRFYELYEEVKKEKNLFDYDDVLENLVKVIEESDEAKYFIKEQYQYILIDEHQDSSGVQNQFLEIVWKGEDKPNIFVVGDDRQLIYGFGGASLEYFENFKYTFGTAKQIILTENYRSTQAILDSAHTLLESSISKEKLKSNNTEDNDPIRLVEASYPRDEIIICGLEIKGMIGKGMDPSEIAILVPKNRQARTTIAILRDMGIPVASGEKLNFFDSLEAQAYLRVLRIIANPSDSAAISESIFDRLSGISPIEAHKFTKAHDMYNFSLLGEEESTLFKSTDKVSIWIDKLRSWFVSSSDLSIYSLAQIIGAEFLLDTAKTHEDLVMRTEVIRTLLHLILLQIEKDKKITLRGFLDFIDRLEAYGEHIPLAVFSADEGVKVLTLHGSKGLEFDYVWIAHMDEESISGSNRNGFALPESLEERVEKKDTEVLKRELYVAITRAKRFCTLSYALNSYTGGELMLADIINDMKDSFDFQNEAETEQKILERDPRAYAERNPIEEESITLNDLEKLVAKDYEDRKVSVTLLNNFFECPWKWYFRNLLQLPEPKTETLEFGNIVHSSIDKIIKLNIIPEESEIKEIIHEQVRKTGFGTQKKQEELAKEAFDIIARFVDDRLPEIAKNRENEQSVSLSNERFPHLSFYGKIDLIEILKDNEVCVTDFKTGSPRKKNEIEKMDDESRMSDYMRQLAMYSYLLGENSKWKKNVTESKLEFVQAKDSKEMFYRTSIDSERIDLLVRDITDYDIMLKSGKWTSRPCNFKSYGKQNTECEYCKRAEIYK